MTAKPFLSLNYYEKVPSRQLSFQHTNIFNIADLQCIDYEYEAIAGSGVS